MNSSVFEFEFHMVLGGRTGALCLKGPRNFSYFRYFFFSGKLGKHNIVSYNIRSFMNSSAFEFEFHIALGGPQFFFSAPGVSTNLNSPLIPVI